MDTFVARQPIFDRQKRVYGYELLFRSGSSVNRFEDGEATQATTRVISAALLSIGPATVLSGKKAFINFDRSNLLDGLHSVLEPETLVVEILETVEPDPDVIAACQELRNAGYTLALDDFVDDPRFEPFTRLANVIKVDLLLTGKKEQERLLRTYKPRGVKFLAEKVETQEVYDAARRAGYDFFQGYFFARPVILRGKQIPPVKATCIRLLHEVQKKELDFDRLKSFISRDVALTYTMLRYVNSTLFGFRAEIHSIERSLLMLGEANVRRWVLLAALPILSKGKPAELVTLSLVRGRFCERLAQVSGVADPEEAFLMGLFSLLDVLIDLPLDAALAEAKVAPRVRAALVGSESEEDPLQTIHVLQTAYEAGDWDRVIAAGVWLNIENGEIARTYAESLQWVQQVLALNQEAEPIPAGSARGARSGESSRLAVKR